MSKEPEAVMYSENKASLPYSVVKGSDIIVMQSQRINYLVNEVGIDPVLARSLLIKYGWSLTTAKNNFLSHGVEKIFNFTFATKTMAQEAESLGELFECPCCYEEYDSTSSEIIAIDTCGHCMCIDCYEAYLDQKM